MFANNKFTQKHAPVFLDSCDFREGERLAYTAVKPYIFTDTDKPPKVLINIDFLTIPIEDVEKGKYKTKYYDIDGFMSFTPEDAITFIRAMSILLSEIFKDENYVHRR